MKYTRISVFIILLFTAAVLKAQHGGKIIDEIVAIVGDNYILRSDIDKEFATIEEQTGEQLDSAYRYDILNSLVAKKIFLYQAQLDSITISDDRVNSEIERRMQFILRQFPGGEDEFEKYLGKSITEFKAQTRDKLYQEMLVQEMQQKILKDTKITPSEVKKYYKSIPTDSLPYVDASVSVAQILRLPKVTQEEKDFAYRKLERIRKDIVENGSDFEIMATIESQDPSSSGKGGETGFFGRGMMVPEFEAMAFKLKGDTVSRIFETQYGYHIMKLIERRGERVNVRHILIRPSTVTYDLMLAREALDTLLQSIIAGRITFEKAAQLYSDDEFTKANGGRIADHLGNFAVPLTALDKDVFEAVGTMKAGDYLGPKLVRQPDNTDGYKLYYLIEETEPHVPTLETDWLKIQNAALEKKKQDVLDAWIARHKKEFYIKIIDKFASHPALQHWAKN